MFISQNIEPKQPLVETLAVFEGGPAKALPVDNAMALLEAEVENDQYKEIVLFCHSVMVLVIT